MNITHVVEDLNRGGLERMVLELVKIQQQQGHRCQVLCLFEPGVQANELEACGIPVTACHKQPGLDLRALAQARRTIREHHTEVLHTHNAVAHYQAVAASCGLKLPRILNTRHGMSISQRRDRREWLYRRALPLTDAVVTVCEAARHDAVAQGIVSPALAKVVPNGISLDSFPPASGQVRLRLLQMLGLPSSCVLIGNVGRLNRAKDQVGLIRAFRQLHAEHPETRLLIIGDGELRQELEQCAHTEAVADAVYLMGDRSDVRELLRGLDLFVLSSRIEGYSMALLEACAAALPIIATDVGGNREIIQHGRTGKLVPAGDPAVLAGAMRAMLQQPQLASAYGRAARLWVEQNGTLEVMAGQYAQLYQARGR